MVKGDTQVVVFVLTQRAIQSPIFSLDKQDTFEHHHRHQRSAKIIFDILASIMVYSMTMILFVEEHFWSGKITQRVLELERFECWYTPQAQQFRPSWVAVPCPAPLVHG